MAETKARFLADTQKADTTAEAFTWPTGRASQDNYVLAMSDKTTGETAWQVTATAPTITGITSGQLNSYYDADGTTVSNDKGGTLVIAGTDFGTTIADISAVRICASDGTSQISATTVSSVNDTSITATWNGTESGYSTFSGVYYVEIVKSGMVSNRFNSTKSISGDPTISSVTGTGGEGDGVTVTSSNLGSYGGKIAGGGQESNTKILLNFDRRGGTDFEDSSNTSDDGHRVTASGDATIKSSPFGDGKSGIFFDGTNDYLQVANTLHNDLDSIGTGAFTIECWINPSTSTTEDTILNFGRSDNTWSYGLHIGYRWDLSPKKFTTYINATERSYQFDMVAGRWYHIAWVRDASGYVKFYIDGVAYTQTAGAGSDSYQNTTDLDLSWDECYIGRMDHSGVYPWDGYMDEIRFTTTAVYSGDFTVPTSRLSATQSNQGTNIADITGTATKLLIHSNISLDSSNSNHQITHEGNATYNTTSPKWTNRSAMYFDGTSGTGIRIPQSNDFDFGNNAFTVRGWVKPSSASGNEVIFSTTEWNGNDNADGTALMLRKSGSKWYLNATKTDYSGWEFETASSSNVTTSWQHFVVTKAQGSAPVKLIIDGTTEVTTSNITSIAATSGFNNKDFFIGAYLGGQRFTGYISDFEVLKGESTTTSPINSETTKSTNTKLLLSGTTAGLFDDSSNSDHAITPTGSYHSQGHGGIAPALAWPTSLKKNGSAGVYFDNSNSDYLILGADTTGSILLKDDTHVGSIDFWMYAEQLGDYPLDHASGTSYKHTSLVSKGDIVAGFKLTSDGGLLHHAYVSPHTAHCKTAANIIEPHRWYHLCMAWDSDSSISIFVDGVLRARATDSIKRFKVNTHTDAYGPRIGWHRTYSDGYFNGYIDNFRIVQGSLPMDTTGDPLYSSTAFSAMSSVGTTYFSVPTKIYGAMYPASPSVGTITITGATTDSTDIAFTEINNSLPNGLTLNDQGAGNQTATITGTLTEVVSSDTTTNNIRIQAKANADDKRITEVNENYSGASTAGAGNLSITKKAGGEPVLFNARRYDGNQTNREINGFGFAPDFVWLKNRNTGINHCLFDSVRGATKQIDANTNGAESTQATMLTAFNKDGFSHGTDTAGNKTDDGHIAWAWKAGGAPSADGKKKRSNSATEDSLSSGTDYNNITEVRQSVNVEGDFSITKYKGGNGTSNNFFKHGLSGKPDWVIIKRLTSAHWVAWHSYGDSGNADAGDWILLSENRPWGTDENNNAQTYAFFGTGGITNDKIYLQNDQGWTNLNNTEFICYAWKAVKGVSAFGTYEGNSTSSSVTPQTITFPNVGGEANQFAPSFVMIKSIDSTDSWWMFDNKRVASGVRNNNAQLRADTDHTEATNSSSSLGVTLKTDNGFTVHDYGSGVNGNGNTYIYMAFA